jgi:hypothetical protein
MTEAVLARTAERRARRGIYVETLIRAPLDEVWEKTQSPALHQRWDARFTGIEYLPREDDARPRRFRYSTRIGFGVEIEGEGETTATREGADGRRASSLRFGACDGRSLIREGTGYWRYVPTEGGVRFLTWYDYRTRWGMAGRAADAAFRPLMRWATAWSFDRLRLWIERGIDPALSLERSVAHALVRVTLAFIFLWHGIVPKLLARHPDELRMLLDGGVPAGGLPLASLVHGGTEVALGVAVLVFWRSRGLFPLVIAFMAAALAGVAIASPRYLTAAFNPVTLNVAVAALAAVGWAASRDLPSARRCIRHRPENAS